MLLQHIAPVRVRARSSAVRFRAHPSSRVVHTRAVCVRSSAVRVHAHPSVVRVHALPSVVRVHAHPSAVRVRARSFACLTQCRAGAAVLVQHGCCWSRWHCLFLVPAVELQHSRPIPLLAHVTGTDYATLNGRYIKMKKF